VLPLHRDKSLYSSLLQVWLAVYTHASMYSGIYLALSGPAAPLHHIPHVLSIPRSAASTTFQSYKLVTHSRDKKIFAGSFTTSFTHLKREDILWMHYSVDYRLVSQLVFYDTVSISEVAYCRLTYVRTIFPAVYFITLF
jgi:hypothetical protein